jgi:hypothetical protein
MPGPRETILRKRIHNIRNALLIKFLILKGQGMQTKPPEQRMVPQVKDGLIVIRIKSL